MLWVAEPTVPLLEVGLLVACAGEALRVWAAGHLNKSREVTSSGPYRFLSHPLYVGSSIVAVGIVIASRRIVVAVIVLTYLALTFSAAIRSEETFLRGAFGDEYDRYRRGEAENIQPNRARRFSVGRMIENREHRALIGLAVAALLLLLKATYNGLFWAAAGR